MMDVRGRNVAKLLGTLAVKSQMNHPPVSFVGSARIGNAITGQVGFLFYQQTFLDRLFALSQVLLFVGFNSILWRNYLLPLVDSLNLSPLSG